MLNAYKDQLFTLIKSLSKAEKRNFKLYATRNQSSSDIKFIQLFDVLDRLDEYDEDSILKKLPDTKKRHLSNLKRHLYKQILTSLRLIHIAKNIDIQIREQIDFARILYGKGMYMQSLKILDRIKRIADEHHQDILHLEILEFQKLIEARHVTRSRSIENKMERLLNESILRSSVTLTSNRLSNLNIQIQGWYIQHGHIKNEKDIAEVDAFFQENVPDDQLLLDPTFFEKANLYQAHYWRSYILLDFDSCIQRASQWVNLFTIHPQMREKDPDLYVRALYYLLTAYYLRGKTEPFKHYLIEMDNYWQNKKKQLNANSKMIVFTYLNLSRLNEMILTSNYEGGLLLERKILREVRKLDAYMDNQRILLFYYKLAGLQFACGHFDKAIDHLNAVINHKDAQLQEELFINTRILYVLCLFEQGKFDLLDYQLTAVRRAVRQAKESSQVRVLLIQGLRELLKAPLQDHPSILQKLYSALEQLAAVPYEQKAFLFLLPLHWVKSRQLGCYVSQLNGIKV
jgi:hypothetical protein